RRGVSLEGRQAGADRSGFRLPATRRHRSDPERHLHGHRAVDAGLACCTRPGNGHGTVRDTVTTPAQSLPPSPGVGADADNQLVRAIGIWGATLLVIGNVLGSGIFLTTGIMAQELPSTTLVLLAWGVGGLLAMAGGLTYAEMG